MQHFCDNMKIVNFHDIINDLNNKNYDVKYTPSNNILINDLFEEAILNNVEIAFYKLPKSVMHFVDKKEWINLIFIVNDITYTINLYSSTILNYDYKNHENYCLLYDAINL